MFSYAQLSIRNRGRRICDFYWSFWRILCEFTFRPLYLSTDVHTYGSWIVLAKNVSTMVITDINGQGGGRGAKLHQSETRSTPAMHLNFSSTSFQKQCWRKFTSSLPSSRTWRRIPTYLYDERYFMFRLLFRLTYWLVVTNLFQLAF